LVEGSDPYRSRRTYFDTILNKIYKIL